MIHLHKISQLQLLNSTLFVGTLPTNKDGGVLDILTIISFSSMQDYIEQI